MTANSTTRTANRFRLNRSAVFAVCLLSSTVVNAALFRNPEQVAAQKFEQGDYSEAAAEFSDAYRRGISLYRAGRYTEAGEAFASVEREEVKADALYNLGNTLYKRSDYTGAVDAYTASLELRSRDEDTLHNLALAKKMLEQTLTEEVEEEVEAEQAEEEEAEQEQKQEEEKQKEEQESEEKSSGDQEQESE
jgi:Ca-activated chloride channel family protein